MTGFLRLVKSTCNNLGMEVIIASKSGWILERTPRSLSSSQFCFIKKNITYGSSASAL